MNLLSNSRFPLLLALLVINALASLLTGLLLPLLANHHPALSLHIIFTIGFMPLILAAMTYFTPVLTRTGNPPSSTLLIPLLALVAGIALCFSLLTYYRFYPIAALLALAVAIWLLLWIDQRSKLTLGSPHPGLRWYLLALVMLGLAMIAILLASLLPEHWGALKRLHLHLNLLGFIGLTALGTLRVLLPTAAGYSDPGAAAWLTSYPLIMATGVLLIATGSAWNPPLALLGLLLYSYPLLRFLLGLAFIHHNKIFTWHGPGIALTMATFGLVLVLAAGALHGLELHSSRPSLSAFILLFLLPLITGAANHLFPLWLLAGHPSEQQQQVRTTLGRWSSLRTMLFLTAGVLGLMDIEWYMIPALLGLIHFIAAVIRAVVSTR